MVNLPHIDQSADTIRLYLLGETPDSVLDQFTLLSTTSVTLQGGYTLTINILGESHAVTVYQHNTAILREICACTEGVFEDKPFISSFLSALPPTLQTECAPGVAHTFSHERLNWDEGQDRVRKIESNYHDGSNGLLTSRFDFPVIGEDKRQDYTAVWLFKTEGQIEVCSVHTYPNEECFVATTSFLHLPGMGRD